MQQSMKSFARGELAMGGSGLDGERSERESWVSFEKVVDEAEDSMPF